MTHIYTRINFNKTILTPVLVFFIIIFGWGVQVFSGTYTYYDKDGKIVMELPVKQPEKKVVKKTPKGEPVNKNARYPHKKKNNQDNIKK